MQKKRLGCLTATGISVSLITLFIIVGVAFASGGRMFTAGPLNDQNKGGAPVGGASSHAQITECKACHVAPWEAATMAERCADCHTDIAAQMFDVAKLHGAIKQKNPGLPCRDCHPEHRGATASLTDLGKNVFPHEVLGYSLNGHQLKAARETFACSDCHGEDVTTFATDSCLNCHSQMDIAFTQAHILSFGADCTSCHDGVDRFGDDFDHGLFTFALMGKHRDASCTKCHLDARTVIDLQSAPQDCFSCHQKDDPHTGRFGNECGACHASDGWKPAKFDHNLSVFKLVGGHAQVACEDCHQNGVYQGTPGDCYSCHKDQDEHNGEYGMECGSCHNPSDWEDASFDHNRTAFPLNGGHAGLSCQQCHQSGAFAGLSPDCASCHADPGFHAGAFGLNCAACHSTSSWSPAGYNLSHPRVADEGGGGIHHGGASCRTCHPSSVYYATCSACHDGNNFEDGEGDDD